MSRLTAGVQFTENAKAHECHNVLLFLENPDVVQVLGSLSQCICVEEYYMAAAERSDGNQCPSPLSANAGCIVYQKLSESIS